MAVRHRWLPHLDLTRDIVERASKQGTTTQYILLTDGAANVALDGTRNREAGTRDALTAAQRLAVQPVSGLVIDTAQRPQPRARDLADTLRGTYIALPKADRPHAEPDDPSCFGMTSATHWQAVADVWPLADSSRFVYA